MDTPALLPAFAGIIQRDLKLAFRRFGQVVNPLLFFAIVTTLFPLALSPELSQLRDIAPGVLWVAALLSSMLSLEGLFRGDYEDGSLEQMVLSPQPLALLMLAKMIGHWLVSGLPLVIVTPLVATALNVPLSAWPALMLALALGTGTLSAIGSIGAALTLGLRRGSMLLALLVLPLIVPVLIFGARGTDMAVRGESPSGPLFLLAALVMLAASLAPLATAAAIRISLD